MVGGYIESVYLLNDSDIVLICNEEGKMNGMKLNRYIGYDIIAGPFLIVGDDIENGGFKSHTARTMLSNSEFIVMLNQASTDRIELAKLLNIPNNK